MTLPIAVVCALIVAAGCASHKSPTTQPASAYDRQQAALQDPFGYSPHIDSNDVSGGKIDELDRNAMKRDIDDALNP